MSKYDDKYGPDRHDSLSAFLDNEASEKDIEILLATDRHTLARKADRYRQIHQAVQPDSEQWIFDSSEFLSQLHGKLDAGMEDTNVLAFPKRHSLVPNHASEPETHSAPAIAGAPVSRSKRGWMSGLAVAASVAFVVVLGGNVLLSNNPATETPNFAANAPEQDLSVLAATDSDVRIEDNERLQNYLRQHAQQASMTVGQGMIPMAKVVSYPQGKAQ